MDAGGRLVAGRGLVATVVAGAASVVAAVVGSVVTTISASVITAVPAAVVTAVSGSIVPSGSIPTIDAVSRPTTTITVIVFCTAWKPQQQAKAGEWYQVSRGSRQSLESHVVRPSGA
jgi:hypothetical protein